MRRFLTGCVFTLIAVCSAFAIDAHADGRSVFVNNVRIQTFDAPFSGATPEERARTSAEFFKLAKSTDPVSKVKAGLNWKITVGGRVVLFVTPEDAKFKHTTVGSLVATIIQRLVDAFKLPALAADRAEVELPVGVSGTIQLTGWAAGKAGLTSSDKDVAKVERTGGALRVTGLKRGTTTLRAYYNDEEVTVTVTVMPFAFDAAQTLSAQVVGNPADPSVVAGAVSSSIQTRSSIDETCKVWVRVVDAKPLAKGRMTKVKAKVKATGAGYFPFDGDVYVTVKNVGDDLPYEDQLWYSNDPEQVERPGRLYWAELQEGKSARLLYHHQSAYALPQVIRYMVVNPSDKEASVAIALGDSKPDKNPTRAGYVAGDQFLVKWLSRSAEVVQIPPHSIVPLTVRRLGPGETCSGVASLALRKGGAEKLILIGDSVMQQTLYDDWASGQGVIGAWHAVRPRGLDSVRFSLDGQEAGVFPEPFKEMRLDYEVGGRFGFTRIGEKAITNETENTSLPGNFGVIYNIEGTLRNSTSAPAEVEVLFETSAGFGSGLFVLNGELVRVGLIQPKREIVLASIKLPAGTEKPIKIQTMPLSGANYPVTLIVRPTGFESFSVKKR